jgi:hypothetical protein
VVAVEADLRAGLPVTRGGTGALTLASHGVVLGQGTSAVAVTGAGTTGQVLTSNGASADPTFQAVDAGATWTPSDQSGASLVLVNTNQARYSQIGGWVFATFNVTYPATADASAAKLSLPVACVNSATSYGMILVFTSFSTGFTGLVAAGTSVIAFFKTDGTAVTNANLSGKAIYGTAIYRST